MVRKAYSIKFSPKACEDLDAIYDYIADHLHNRDAAENLTAKIENGIMRLCEFPLSCNLVADELLKEKGYRRLIVESYIVFYIVDETEQGVVVMRVLYGRRKYHDIV